jgi:drug/metabolite transporter (DMT)-like permease
MRYLNLGNVFYQNSRKGDGVGQPRHTSSSMDIGIVYTLLAMASFGVLGVLNKLTEVKHCRPSAISALLCLWSAVMIFCFLASFKHSGVTAPAKVIAIAILFGVLAVIASLAFLEALKYGKISTSWLLINLSSAVPAIGSILVYGERVTLHKGVGLGVAAGALFLLYKDKDTEVSKRAAPSIEGPPMTSGGSAATADTRLWLQLMSVAFLTNGLGPFGLKTLAEWHLSQQYQLQYLFFWYLSASAIAAMVFLFKYSRPFKREIAISAGMGLSSVLGQVGMVMALSCKVPGYLVFPVAIGGNLFIVVAAGLILFKERLRSYGIIGLGLGTAALVILAIP